MVILTYEEVFDGVQCAGELVLIPLTRGLYQL